MNKERIFTNASDFLKYLEESKFNNNLLNSVKVKLKGFNEVKNWVTVESYEIIDGELRVHQECGHKVNRYIVTSIYPISQIETVKVIRHEKDKPPVNASKLKFGFNTISVNQNFHYMY